MITRRESLWMGALAATTAIAVDAKKAQAAEARATFTKAWEASYSGTPEPAVPLPPGEPGRDYRPVVVPGGATLPFKVVDGVKVFHLVAEEVDHEFAPGLRAKCWGYNGRVHGPTIEAVEGDRIRIYVTNRLVSRRPRCTCTASSCPAAWTASVGSRRRSSARGRPSATSSRCASTARSCTTRTTTR
jgi:FtsP/CotA-like multicopper oxidase with cupredoxin domain